MIQRKQSVTVLDLRDSPWFDGPGRTVLECATGLKKDNLTIIIGSFRAPHLKTHLYIEEAARRGLKTEPVRERSSYDLLIVKRLVDIIGRHKVDIVHTHELRSNFYGLLAARICSLPVVTTVHGWIANDLQGVMRQYVDRFLMLFFDQIITVSQNLKKKITSFGISPRRVVVVPNALELQQYRIDRTRQNLRKQLGIGHRDILIAKIGRLSREKGQGDLIKAFKKSVGKRTDVHLALIGIGPDEKRLRRQVAGLDLIHNVHFCGFRQDMVDCYNSIDLVVQASYTEGMPNVVIEALAMGVPVIATNAGGTNEILTDGVSGRLVPPGKVECLSYALSEFLKHPDFFLIMAENGRRIVHDGFDSANRTEKIKKIYMQLLTRKGSRVAV
jgi:glycosyltransferase involved in cell wall biosynthesis